VFVVTFKKNSRSFSDRSVGKEPDNKDKHPLLAVEKYAVK
jgi:hypothetical protein